MLQYICTVHYPCTLGFTVLYGAQYIRVIKGTFILPYDQISYLRAVILILNLCDIATVYVELLVSQIFGDLLQKYSWQDFFLFGDFE